MTRTQRIGIFTAVCLFTALCFVFSYAQIEKTMLEVQKIFYFHVSSAFTVFLAFGVTCVCSVLYLIKRQEKFDLLAVASAELGIVFLHDCFDDRPNLGKICVEYMVENWEPRLTSTLILWLMYIGYFILRSALPEEKKRVYTAVLGILAYLDVPIVYFSVELWKDKLHSGN